MTVETKEGRKVLDATSSAPNGLLADKLAKLAGVMKTFSFAKVARFTGKLINEDVAFVKFLNMSDEDFEKLIPAAFRNPDVIAKKIAQLVPTEEGAEAFSPNVKRVREGLDALCVELVDVEVEAKNAWLSSYNIKEQDIQEKVAKQLAKYKKSLVRCIHNAEAYKRAYGQA